MELDNDFDDYNVAEVDIAVAAAAAAVCPTVGDTHMHRQWGRRRV